MAEDKMVRYHHQLNGHESEKTPGDSGGQESLACCSTRGHKESDTTEQLKNNNIFLVYCKFLSLKVVKFIKCFLCII